VELPKRLPGKGVVTRAQRVEIVAAVMWLLAAMQGIPSSGGMEGGLDRIKTHMYLVLVVFFLFLILL
jgi:hypothetical protein